MLVKETAPTGKVTAYKIILDPKNRRFTTPDSIDMYYKDYLKCLENKYNSHEAQLAIVQNANYNYEVHKKTSMHLANVNEWLLVCVLSTTLLCILFIMMYLWIKYRSSKKIITLQESIRNLEILMADKANNNTATVEKYSDNIERLQEQFITIIDELHNSMEKPYTVLDRVNESAIYKKIRQSINQNGIPDSSEIWDSFETLINDNYPLFKDNLLKISNSPFTEEDIRHIYLIKAGFIPTQIAKILNRSRSAISYRRQCIFKKIVTAKSDVKYLDSIIHYI